MSDWVVENRAFAAGVALGLATVVVGSIALYVTVVRRKIVTVGAARIARETARQLERINLPGPLATQLAREANIEGVARDILDGALP